MKILTTQAFEIVIFDDACVRVESGLVYIILYGRLKRQLWKRNREIFYDK